MEWEIVIGLEIHVQLATQSKIFSGSSTAFGAAANTQANAIDLGLPGVLPVLNKEAVLMAVRFGLAIGAEVCRTSVFARKNYFYPDLPKGYQISQMELPIIGKGEVEITLDDGSTRVIGVTRAHLEEDAGKSLHEDFQGMTGVDLNRAGTPLLEIVSEPDLRSAKEAVAYLKQIHTLIQYIGISDGNMAEGSMRCDANVSMRPKGQKEYGTRAEIKNINSFRFVERAINHEVGRQIDILEQHGKIVQETRLYDADKDETRAMRSKEKANDYRYFSDPDLLPVILEESYIQAVQDSLPELPYQKCDRFKAQYKLSTYDANLLTSSRELAEYFEMAAKIAGDAKLTANWVNGDLSAALNISDLSISSSPISAKQLGGLLIRITDQTISGKIAKQVFDALFKAEGPDADTIIETKGLKQVTDSGTIEAIVDNIISSNAAQVEQYRTSSAEKQNKLIGFFVGQVMKASKGKANPQQSNEILRKKL